MLETRQAANIGNIAPADDPNPVIPGTLYLSKILTDALAGLAIERKRPLDIIHGEAGTQGYAFRGDDIAQLLTFGALDLDVSFGHQALEMPVHRPDRYSQLSSQRGLVDIWVTFDIFEKGQLAELFV
jgi:hypothetical protein